MSNRLANESSLYLQQHADQPVHWWPWCDEAFEAAQKQNKPVLVSIGYSSCHWCHVMAHESFDDPFIAGLMNQHFICIKVDREERPDVDHLYMQAVQMIAQRGGWPLNVFLLPDRRPFFGGTYFPPEDRGHGIIPWPQLLMRVAEFYRKNPAELAENADNIIKNLIHGNTPYQADDAPLDPQSLLNAGDRICAAHDDEWGGFGDAPKFPPTMVIDFLLALRMTAAVEQRPTFSKRIDSVVQTTMEKMARGGLYDQLGGGFSRYSVDRFWHIPHFEKMLYDNGLMLSAYTRSWKRYRNPLYADIIVETIDWLQAEMRLPNGLYAAAIDADSEGEEGRYYVWTPAEIHSILGQADGERFCRAYAVSEEGNFEGNTTQLTFPAADHASRTQLAELRQRLLQHRRQRVAPVRDPKALLAWNSLVLNGIAEAAFAFGRKDWMQTAIDLANALWDHFHYADDRVHSVLYDSEAAVSGYLDDYAFFAEALLATAACAAWVQPAATTQLIERAATLARSVLAHFKDPHQAGFHFTADDHETLPTRRKEWYDNALPCGNSSLVHVFSLLADLDSDGDWASELQTLKQAYPQLCERAPNAIAHALSGFTQDLCGHAALKIGSAVSIDRIQALLADRPWRRVFLLPDSSLAADSVQLCIGHQCLPPTSDLEETVDAISAKHHITP